MIRRAYWPLCLLALTPCASSGGEKPAAPDARRHFTERVYPLLLQKCFKCHSGPDAPACVRLDVRQTYAGENGEAGLGAGSTLLARVLSKEPVERMPPPKAGPPLTEAEVALLRRWIDDGLAWDDRLLPPRDAAANHWAFRPIRRPPVPRVACPEAGMTPVDAFLAAEHERRGLTPAAEASPATLLRRLTLDLTGLPPTEGEVAAFLAAWSSDRDKAVAALVDRLLASPHYGERWGRHWLDLAHWAESDGYEANELRPSAWRYRDYVVDSFRRDKPHGRFLLEQLAGDELEPYADENLVATGFLAATRTNNNEEDKKVQLHEPLVEITNLVGSALLGLTFQCAQCHDHKFDPLTGADYYRLHGYFLRGQTNEMLLKDDLLWRPYRDAVDQPDFLELNKRWRETLDAARAKRPPAERDKKDLSDDKLIERLDGAEREAARKLRDRVRERTKAVERLRPTTWAFFSPATSPHAVQHVPPRGQYPFSYEPEKLKKATPRVLKRGDVQHPGAALSPGWPEVFRGDGPKPAAGSRRELAEWIASPRNPLAARVWVNFVWHQHFGRGLVEAPGDFGVRAAAPSHPELLDWLAADFLEHGGSTKQLHRRVVLSRAFRRGTAGDGNDPDNRWLTAWRPRRLEAEAIRDGLLAVAGVLDRTVGGESVPPDRETASDRRGLYLTQKRHEPPATQALFDGPSMLESCPRRTVSTVPLQPLYLLNHPLPNRAAAAFARGLLATAAEDDALVRAAFLRALSRDPDADELRWSRAFLGRRPGEAVSGDARRARVTLFCQALLNINEFVYVP